MTATTQECWEQYWTSPGNNTSRDANCTATCLPSWKLYRSDGRSKDELISDILLWTPTYGQAKAGRPARTYIQQLCEDTGCNSEDLPEAMNDREKWREMVKDIRAGGTTWWWWYIWQGIACAFTHMMKKIYIMSSIFWNLSSFGQDF